MKAIEETIMAALLAIILVGCASDGARKLSGAGKKYGWSAYLAAN